MRSASVEEGSDPPPAVPVVRPTIIVMDTAWWPTVRLGGARRERYLSWEDPKDEVAAYLRPLRGERQANPERCLWEFIDLGIKPEEEILAFANARGVLGLCRHDMPASHNAPADEWLREDEDRAQEAIIKGYRCTMQRREPIAAWRLWAQRFRAVLSIAAELAYDRPGSTADWEVLHSMVRDEPSGSYPTLEVYRGESLEDEWGRLHDVLDYWTRIGQVCPVPQWGGLQGLRLVLAGKGLFGMLAAQLVTVVSSHQGVVKCSRCRRLTATRHKPRRDQPVYCSDDCRHEAMKEVVRESQRRRRAQIRAERTAQHTRQGETTNG
jgi:hypothetical protein